MVESSVHIHLYTRRLVGEIRSVASPAFSNLIKFNSVSVTQTDYAVPYNALFDVFEFISNAILFKPTKTNGMKFTFRKRAFGSIIH